MQATGTEAKNRFAMCVPKLKPIWIDEQNGRFERNGLWCDDLRVW